MLHAMWRAIVPRKRKQPLWHHHPHQHILTVPPTPACWHGQKQSSKHGKNEKKTQEDGKGEKESI